MKKKNQKYFYAYSRERQKVVRCKTQDEAWRIADEAAPEYRHVCEKCGCICPIN